MNFVSDWRANKPVYFRDIIWKTQYQKLNTSMCHRQVCFSLNMPRERTGQICGEKALLPIG
jgi:hypothetical protein